MTGTFLDVDAPDTAWRGTSEDPIPVLLGRYSKTAFAYRFLTGRPLDGHARTNATFWHAGTHALTLSGHTAAHNYWPGWKRGLLMTRLPGFVLAPWTLVAAGTDYVGLHDPWWLDAWAPGLAWLPLLGYGSHRGVRYVQTYRHEKQYLRPIRQAAWAVLRTRDGVYVDIPRGMVHGKDLAATGRIGLPAAQVADGDRDRLLDAVRERLGHEALDARWNMEGAKPYMELWTPPQPPGQVDWHTMLQHADTERPYLGHSAAGAVHWDLGDDSPHIGIGGGAGSGKSELMAWIVAQFMRGGCGTVLLDPKYVSHGWLARIPEVLYCREPQMIHDTVVWLDMELRRRGAAAAAAADAGEPEPEFDRIVVVLEERNSLQTIIRDHWIATRPKGAPLRAPALAALDRLASMGRSFRINVILAAQEVTRAEIGSRNNFGAFALAGRLPVGAWRLVMGPSAKKPAMSAKPGRFGYAVAGTATVFQAAYPDLREQAERLIAFATSGVPLLDVKMMMQQFDTPIFPRWEPATSPEDDTEEYVSLRDFAELDEVPYSLAALRLHSQRDGRTFPDVMGTGAQNAKLYRLADLYEWLATKQGDGE
ncbi:MAG: hypothetical protein JF597_01285 [Streptomyces sp.]|uniref:hypothetical protein n=1 Tax=Streptomyces sp. TaxID=1931 RepID=UPI0025F9A39B|nr:hypothetical protein [Streptomyces sp.]MBW8792267.1 hypothetical protein [Streptomyces sp.]